MKNQVKFFAYYENDDLNAVHYFLLRLQDEGIIISSGAEDEAYWTVAVEEKDIEWITEIASSKNVSLERAS